MFRRRVALALPVFLALTVVSIAARAASTNGANPINASMAILTAKTLNGKSVKAGTYDVTADDTKVTFKSNGKMVAEASIEWKNEAAHSKSAYIVTNGDEIREIHFNGKTRYAVIAE